MGTVNCLARNNSFDLFSPCFVSFMVFSLSISHMQENGYQLLFLSARSISQAYLTRQFLVNLKQVMFKYSNHFPIHLDNKIWKERNSFTFSYLFYKLQDGKVLPDGPVVISPDGLFPSLYREGNVSFVSAASYCYILPSGTTFLYECWLSLTILNFDFTGRTALRKQGN